MGLAVDEALRVTAIVAMPGSAGAVLAAEVQRLNRELSDVLGEVRTALDGPLGQDRRRGRAALRKRIGGP